MPLPHIKPSHLLTARLGIVEVVAWGVLYYTFSVYLPLMEAELGWSTAKLAAGFSLALLVSGVIAPFVGRWIDRHGSRTVMVAGAMCGSMGVALWSIAHSLPSYLAAWVLIGGGMAGTLYAPAFATVVRAHPTSSRGAILTITLVGALASTLFLPLSSALNAMFGWRPGLLLLACLMATITIPLCASLPAAPTATIPSQHVADALTGSAAPARQPSAPSQPAPAGALATFTVALMLADAVSVAINAHLIAFLIAAGQPIQTAASIAGVAGMAKVAGRLATAAAAKLSALRLLRASLFVMAAALLLPLLWPTTTAMVLMVVFFGATGGARTVLRPAIVVEMHGASNFGANNGLLQLFTTLAKAAGPLGLAILLNTAGSGAGWTLLALLMALSGGLLLRLRPAAKLVHTRACADERIRTEGSKLQT